MNISAVIAQFPISFSIKTNLDMIDSVLAQAQPGDLVVFPEGSVSGYADDLSFLPHIDQDELFAGLQHLHDEAQRCSINLWAGACIYQDGQWFNAAYGFTPDGKTLTYHKVNLATHERGIFTAGNHLPVFELLLPGGRVKIGVQLCREIRFPEQWGWLARQGAQIILHLTNGINNDAVQPVLKSHLISRAAETQRFVLSANNAASKQQSPTIAIAPDGQVLGEIVSAELGVLRVNLDLSKTSDWYLSQCRSDVVEIQSSQLADEV